MTNLIIYNLYGVLGDFSNSSKKDEFSNINKSKVFPKIEKKNSFLTNFNQFFPSINLMEDEINKAKS